MTRWTPIVAILVASAVAVALPPVQKLFGVAMRGLSRIARVRGAPIVFVFVVALILAAMPALIWGLPLPVVHDEFGYLLAGDTFAHGRLTNPPHKLAVFFETFHVLQSPTYAAKFPIGQGLSLALGIVLIGLPIAGVWITIALACAAVTWMLGAAMPRRHALLGGLFVAIHPMTVWWSSSYWGGGVAMLGGALFSGAALRAAKAPRFAWGLLPGAGLAILANSRPLEGLLMSLIVIVWLTWRAARGGRIASHVWRTALPAALLLAPTFAFMMYYNWRVTHNALELPYVAHQKQYMVAPLLYYQRPADPAPVYHHGILRDFYADGELAEYREQLDPIGPIPAIGSLVEKWQIIGEDFVNLGPLAALLIGAIVAAAARRRDRAARLAWMIWIILPLSHMLITPWFRPAYLAGAVGFLAMLFVLGVRELERWRVGPARWSLGRAVASFVVLAQALSWPIWARAFTAQNRPAASVARAALLEALEATPGKHLVFVRYGPHHSALFEWVYNGADIDGSKVIFARSMGDAKDRELLEYFSDRQIVRIDFDENRAPMVRRWNEGEWP